MCINRLYCIKHNKINCWSLLYRNIFTNVNSGGLKTAGDTYKLPKLADTLKIIAVEGVNAIYNGSLTTKIVHDLRKANGIITNKDLSDYK